MTNIEKEIELYQKEYDELQKKLEKLKNDKAVLTAQYKQAMKNLISTFPDEIKQGMTPKEVLTKLEEMYVKTKSQLEETKPE